MRYLYLTLVSLVACEGATSSDVDALRAEVDALKARVAELETARSALEAQATSNSDRLDAADPTLASAADLLAVVAINGDGDVVFTGTNVLIQSGAGSTDATPNGTGNLVVGYNEPETDGMCVGGTSPGMACTVMSVCPGGGTCDITVLSERTGSHNVVIGRRQSYSSYGSIVAGEGNTSSGPGSVLTGAGHTCSAGYALLGGVGHDVSGMYATAIGGSTATVSSSSGVAVGGLQCAVTHDRAVCLGGSSNASTMDLEVFP